MFAYCLIIGLGILVNSSPIHYVCQDLPDYSTYKVHMTAYDPDLGGQNCMEPCGYTAIGYKVEEWYGLGAGCPLPLLQYGVDVEIRGRTFRCIDTGGVLFINDDSKTIRIDLLRKLTYNGVYTINRNDSWLHDTEVTNFRFRHIPYWNSDFRRNIQMER